MSLIIENNERLDIRRQCGGRCCSSMACEVSTEDFISKYGKITKESVIKALRDGEWAIDWWEGDIRVDEPDLCTNLPKADIGDYVCQSGGPCCPLQRVSSSGDGLFIRRSGRYENRGSRKIVRSQDYFDYLKGRVLKVDLSNPDCFDERLYDRDNDYGAADRAVEKALISKAQNV